MDFHEQKIRILTLIPTAFRCLLIAATLLVSSCASLPHRNCSGAYSLVESNWYKKYMQAAGVKPLCPTRDPGLKIFRLTWLRSFHNPIVVTISRRENEVSLEAMRLGGMGGYGPGKIVERRKVDLGVEDFDAFVSIIDSIGFWGLKSDREVFEEMQLWAISQGSIITRADGAMWIIEGATHAAAYAVDRWGPDDGPFFDAGLFLLEKSGIDLNGPIY